MLTNESIEHGIEFLRPLPLNRCAIRPDFENVSGTVYERTTAQGRADDGYFPTKEPKVPYRFAEMQFYEPFNSIYRLPKFRATEGSKIGKSKIG
jgi:hypothetical protein